MNNPIKKIYLTISSNHGGGAGLISEAMKTLSDDEYQVEYGIGHREKIHGNWIWCNWSPVVLHYNYEDCPDRPLKKEKLKKNIEDIKRILHNRDNFIIQVWPNANTDTPSFSLLKRTRNAPYPVAKPRLLYTFCDDVDLDFDNKPFDIYSSWSIGGWSGKIKYREKITNICSQKKWGNISGGIYLKSKVYNKNITKISWGKNKGLPIINGRIKTIKGKYNDDEIWKDYMVNFVAKSKVGWDSLGNDCSPYCHRFSEYCWGGMCVIREGKVCDWYKEGEDYIVEPDPVKAVDIAFDLIRSGSWLKIAKSAREKWLKYECSNAVAKYLIKMLDKGHIGEKMP